MEVTEEVTDLKTILERVLERQQFKARDWKEIFPNPRFELVIYFKRRNYFNYIF